MHPSRRETQLAASILVFISLGILFGSPVAADDAVTFQPYTVYVVQEESHARCGPSPDDYQTDDLRHGQALQVYAESEDGWLGIRPPESSFSWIPAETIEVDASGDNGIVTEDRTVAWIGTNLGRARSYRWQVRLAKGEPVTIIGKSEREGPDGPQLWYRIVPPSGEFRWVHREQVVTTSEELVASIDRDAAQPEIMLSQAGPTTARSRPVADRPARSESAKMAKRTSSRQSRADRDEAAEVDSDRLTSEMRQVAQASGVSVVDVDSSMVTRSAIGSGLREDWQNSQRRTRPVEPTSATSEPMQNDSAAMQSPPSLRAGTDPEGESVGQTMKRKGLLASVAFLNRPKLLQIGTPAEPATVQTGAADNWVSGVGRRSTAMGSDAVAGSAPAIGPASHVATASLGTPMPQSAIGQASVASSPIQQASATQDWGTANLANQPSAVQQTSGALPLPAQNLVPAGGWNAAPQSNAKPMNVISADRIDAVRREVQGADIDRLTLVLSRLMAAQASGLETEPVAMAARQLASTSTDAATAQRARELSDRADQYRRIATRRDGSSMVQSSGDVTLAAGTESIPAASVALDLSGRTTPAPSTSIPADPGQPSIPASPASPSYGGQLVQVYSARPNSPPFALTDHTGRTIAYVTPMPGVNLRTHLNSRVTVVGNTGFLPGLNMPHVLASQAVRMVE
ncbi:hypothetical protein K227x_48350 [Rubripirellula lacrimiformis]|uniref:Uncharacterized protein n=1 Tax=Rubripirellula lacrimiformis TaxID=1930273 RepID=A0A517NH16_9BACT|nr:hypothetical protein [Rubripirellula lacrimiformis]QDT06425.1 hypothetical protein K227x_48350 [Rubripirellula lacrimiformis]